MGNINSMTLGSNSRRKPILSDMEMDETLILIENDIQLHHTSYLWKRWKDPYFREREAQELILVKQEFIDPIIRSMNSFRQTYSWAETRLFSATLWHADNHEKQALAKGIITGIASFVLLRYGVHPAIHPRVSAPIASSKSWFTSPTGETGRNYWLNLSLDLLCCGGLVSFWGYKSFLEVNTPEELSLVSKIPLLPGRSELCHAHCPDIVARANSISSDTTKVELWNDPQTVQLKEIRNLVMNCQRRAMYEDHLRKKHGIPQSTGPVEIPMPGVMPAFSETDGAFNPAVLERQQADHLTTDRDER